jgi:tetratricopeptide (TPR) repeat protein
MANQDWFRRQVWSAGDERDFFARLGRSRTQFHKAQYLRIQASVLADTDDDSLIRTALALLQKLFAEFPEPSQLPLAYIQAAKCYERLADLPKATEQFRLALVAEARIPTIDSRASIEFPWFVVCHGLSNLHDEAVAVLDTADLVFPVQRFKAAAVRAFVANGRGQAASAAEHAREALDAAETRRSPFSRHPSMGLVGQEYRSMVERLGKIAAV